MIRTKLFNYLKGFHIIAISENTSKYNISNSKEGTYHGVPLQQIRMLLANIFSERTTARGFCGVMQIFLELI